MALGSWKGKGRGQPTFARDHAAGRLESLTGQHVGARPKRERAHSALVVRGVVAVLLLSSPSLSLPLSLMYILSRRSFER